MQLVCIGFLVSLQHTSGSCSIIICIPMVSCTTFHWEVVANQVTHLESYGCDTSHYVTSSHLRSKEFINIHKPCMPHSRDTTKCTPVCTFGCSTEQWCTSNKHNTLI